MLWTFSTHRTRDAASDVQQAPRIHSLAEMNACKSDQCFPLCNLPLHDLVSHQTPHLSMQRKSAKLMSILIKLSVQHVRTVCEKPRVGLEQLLQKELIVSLYFIPCRKGNFHCCRIHRLALTPTLNITTSQK